MPLDRLRPLLDARQGFGIPWRGFRKCLSSCRPGGLMLVPFLSPDPERGKLLAEFNPVLKELVAAFGTKDSVLIGDLLEYEIAPRMQRLAPLLGRAT